MEHKNLKPAGVFRYFEEICQVPRPSKKEEKIIAYLQDFGKKQGLETLTDEAGNILMRKPATHGMENCKTVALQAHMDMVCEKNNDVHHDFLTDPIETIVDGEWMKAKGTTLGADNGIGVATALAVLADESLVHGPLECLFTVDEETGLTGAFALKEGLLHADILLNLDSEDEGELFIGCAGGVDSVGEFSYQEVDVPDGYFYARVQVKGLLGGHSGSDIHMGRANANKLLARFLNCIRKKYDVYLCGIDGGNLRNAIAREAYAIIAFPESDKHAIRADLNVFAAEVEREYAVSDPGIQFILESETPCKQAIEPQVARQVLMAIQALPHGQRSSITSAKEDIADTVRTVFELAGAVVSHSEGYPGWKPNTHSEILEIATESYRRLFHTEAKVKAIHAGLECGLFLDKYPALDMISFGPTLQGVHSPDERMNIPSVERFWVHLVDILKNIPEKK